MDVISTKNIEEYHDVLDFEQAMWLLDSELIRIEFRYRKFSPFLKEVLSKRT